VSGKYWSNSNVKGGTKNVGRSPWRGMGYKSGNGTDTKSAENTKQTTIEAAVFFSVHPSFGAMRQKNNQKQYHSLDVSIGHDPIFFRIIFSSSADKKHTFYWEHFFRHFFTGFY
jgi:hypothetical protein